MFPGSERALQPYTYTTNQADDLGARINGTQQCVLDDYTGAVANGTMSGGTGKLSDGVFGRGQLQSGTDCNTNPWVGWRVKGAPLTISFFFCGHMEIKAIIVNTWVVPAIRSKPLVEVRTSIFCGNHALNTLSDQFQSSASSELEPRVENRSLNLGSDNASVCLSNGSVSMTLFTVGKWLLLGEIEFQGEGEVSCMCIFNLRECLLHAVSRWNLHSS